MKESGLIDQKLSSSVSQLEKIKNKLKETSAKLQQTQTLENSSNLLKELSFLQQENTQLRLEK